MNLILLENESSAQKIDSLPGYKAGEDAVICFNYLAYLRLKSMPISHKYFFSEELLTEEDYKSLHSATDRFASTWYYIGGKDATVFDGVSFGNISKVTFSRTYMLSILVKYGEIIRIAKEKWPQVKKVYFDFTNDSNYFYYYVDDAGKFFNKRLLVESVSRQLELESVYIPADKVMPSAFLACLKTQSNFHKFSLKEFMRRKAGSLAGGLHNMLNFLLFPPFTANGAGKAYFFNYFNIRSLIKYHSRSLIIPGFGLKDHAKTLFSGLTFFDFDKVRRKPSREEKDFIGSLEDVFFPGGILRSDCDFKFKGIDYAGIYGPTIKGVITDLIPRCLKYIGQVRKGLERCRIRKAIVNDIVDEKNSSFISACRLENIPVSFIDHGIQSLHNAQKVVGSVIPDEYFTAGPLPTYDIPLKPLALGNPSMDIYPSENRKKVTQIKKVLFLTFQDSFYWRLDRFAYQEKYYAEIFPAFRRLKEMGIEVYYRTHFENSDYHEYLLDFFGVERPLFKLAEGGRFIDLIYSMDLLVCNVTNCFYEAQAAGVPTIFLEPHFIKDALLPPLNGVHGEDVLRVSSADELIRMIERNKDNPQELNAFLERFLEKHAPSFMGRLDGLASQRIAEYLFKDLNQKKR